MTSASRFLTLLPACGLLLVLAYALWLTRYPLPAPTGPHAVGTRTLHLTDTTRPDPFRPNAPRELVVQLWYPTHDTTLPLAPHQRWAESTWRNFQLALIKTHSRLNATIDAPTPLPVILFNPKWQGSRTQNTLLCEELASRGFLVAAIDHPGNAERVALSNGQTLRGHDDMRGPLGAHATPQQQVAYWNRSLDLWTTDSIVALNRLDALNAEEHGPFSGRIDTAHTVAIGHSFGGATSLALLGRDPRVLAAVNMDGWTFAALDHRTTQPVLIFYGRPLSGDTTSSDPMDTLDDRIVHASISRYGGDIVHLPGAQHADFTDTPFLPRLLHRDPTGPIPPATAFTTIRDHILTFLSQRQLTTDNPVTLPLPRDSHSP